jgi:hypothetical protein
MNINFENEQIEAEKICDRGWDGIIVFDAKTGAYYLYDLVWHGGGYVDRIKKISEKEYINFRDLGKIE